MKKFISFLLFIVVIFSLAVPAWAANDVLNTAVTVRAQMWEQDFSAYKIADIVSKDTTADGTEVFQYSFVRDGDYAMATAVCNAIEAYSGKLQTLLPQYGADSAEKAAIEQAIVSATNSVEQARKQIVNSKPIAVDAVLSQWLYTAFTVRGSSTLGFDYSVWFNNLFVPELLREVQGIEGYSGYTCSIPTEYRYHTIGRDVLEAGWYIFESRVSRDVLESEWVPNTLVDSAYMSGNVYSGRVLYLTIKNSAPTLRNGFNFEFTPRIFAHASTSDEWHKVNYVNPVYEVSDYIGANESRTQQILITIPRIALAVSQVYPITIHEEMVGCARSGDIKLSYFDTFDLVMRDDSSMTLEAAREDLTCFLAEGDYSSANILYTNEVAAHPFYTPLTEGYSISDGTDSQFEITFDDLLQTLPSQEYTASEQSLGIATTADVYILIEYPVKVAADMETYASDYAWLTYPIDPTAEKEPETNDTFKQATNLYTYNLVIDKTDESGEPLTGAEFKLERWVAEVESSTGSLALEPNHRDYLRGPIPGYWEEILMDDARSDVSISIGAGKPVSDSPRSQFTWSYLQDGLYRLTETRSPAGYQGVDPMYFLAGKVEGAFDYDDGGDKDDDMAGEMTSYDARAVEGLGLIEARSNNFMELLPVTAQQFDEGIVALAPECVAINDIGNAFRSHGGLLARYDEYGNPIVCDNGLGWYFTDSALASGGWVSYALGVQPMTDGYGNDTAGYWDGVGNFGGSLLPPLSRGGVPVDPAGPAFAGEITVVNSKGVLLPETGGIGVYLMYFVGFAALLLDIGTLISIKRRKVQ